MKHALIRRSAVMLAAAVLVAAACGCGQGGASAATTPRPHCPAALLPGYQHLADRVGTAVYCPSWLPSPLVGKVSPSAVGGAESSSGGSRTSISCGRDAT